VHVLVEVLEQGAAGVAVLLHPTLVDFCGLRLAIAAVEEHDLATVAVRLEEGPWVVLCAA